PSARSQEECQAVIVAALVGADGRGEGAPSLRVGAAGASPCACIDGDLVPPHLAGVLVGELFEAPDAELIQHAKFGGNAVETDRQDRGFTLCIIQCSNSCPLPDHYRLCRVRLAHWSRTPCWDSTQARRASAEYRTLLPIRTERIGPRGH